MKRNSRTISVDFDGTLASYYYPKIGEQRWIHKIVLWWVLRQQRKGDYIILWTCRNGVQLDLIVSWLQNEFGFIPDAVNEDRPENKILYPGTTRKIMADLLIDDRQVGLIGWMLRRVSR